LIALFRELAALDARRGLKVTHAASRPLARDRIRAQPFEIRGRPQDDDVADRTPPPAENAECRVTRAVLGRAVGREQTERDRGMGLVKYGLPHESLPEGDGALDVD